MPVWNPNDPNDWGRLLGMVAVPMFARARAAKTLGSNHVILLDGERSSFALSHGPATKLLEDNGPLSWAWSSNVNYSFVFDQEADSLLYRRWDSPKDIREKKSPSPSFISQLIDDFDSVSPPQDHSVIDRSMRVFRIVREGVQESGGDGRDAMIAFTALLEFAEWIRESGKPLDSFRDATVRDISNGRWSHAPPFVPPSTIEHFPIGEFVIPLLEGEQKGEYSLDPNLLVRHASGTVFQEAHIQLVIQATRQKSLWILPSREATPPRGEPKPDAYFTPPSLARALVEKAIAEHRRLNGKRDSIVALDPACGSGVFLIETLRETQNAELSLLLRGIDTSSVACMLTEFSLRHAIQGDEKNVKFEIRPGDSLDEKSWGDPDIILMNPPFTSWADMSEGDKNKVREALGPERYYGRADKSAAFIAKAVDNLKPGAVLASLIPQSFLTSRFAHKIRDHITDAEDINICLVGEITGFRLFRGPTVETAFVVLSRSHKAERFKTQQLIASDQDSDRAIRALRLQSWQESEGDKYLRIVDSGSGEEWRPRRLSQVALADKLEHNDVPRLASLFRVFEGIRTGDNHVFMVTAAGMAELGISIDHEAFRPAASNSTIRVGRLLPSRYVFYPYTEDGEDMFPSEDEVRSSVPSFYEQVLRPNRPALEKRSGVGGPWWSLTRRRTWQARRYPRLISTVFGDPGSFTYDRTGRFAVVQGFFWNWRAGGDFHAGHLPLAYVAILNSTAFNSVCRLETRQMQGGQLDLYPDHIKGVHLPNLSMIPSPVVGRLAEFGDSILSGIFPDLGRLDEMVARCYGVSVQEFYDAIPESDISEQFERLTREWRRDTSHLSNPKHITAHPAFQQIVRLGETVLPLISEKLRAGDGGWFYALRDITGADPVAAGHRGKVREMTRDWLDWLDR